MEEASETAERSGATDILLFARCSWRTAYFAGRVSPHRLDEANIATHIRALLSLGSTPALPASCWPMPLEAAAEPASCRDSRQPCIVVGHGSKFGPSIRRRNHGKVAEQAAAAATIRLGRDGLPRRAAASRGNAGRDHDNADTSSPAFLSATACTAAEDGAGGHCQNQRAAPSTAAHVGTSPHVPQLIAAATPPARSPSARNEA